MISVTPFILTKGPGNGRDFKKNFQSWQNN